MQRGKNLKFLSSHPALHNDYVTQQVLESESGLHPDSESRFYMAGVGV